MQPDQIIALMDNISDGVVALDKQFVVVYFNKAAETLLKRSLVDVVGKRLFDAFPEGRGSVFEQRYCRALADKRPDQFEAYFDVDPYRDWYEVRIQPYEEGIIIAFQIITARKQAQDLLIQQADLLNHAHDAIIAWEFGNRIIQWYRGAELLYGWSKNDAIGQTAHELLHTIPPASWDSIERTLRQTGLWEGELHQTTRDGHQVVVESRLALVQRDQHQIVLEINRDITSRKQNEERLARLRAIAAAFSTALTPAEVARIVLTEGLAVLRADAGSIALLSPDRSTLNLIYDAGYPLEVMARWKQIPVDAEVALADAVRQGTSMWFESPAARNARYPSNPTPDIGYQALAAIPLIVEGQTIGAMSLGYREEKPVSEEDRAFAMTLAQQAAQALERSRLYLEVQNHATALERTVAERTQALQDALEQAKNAEKTKDTLMSTVTHEMRTPLSSIIGFSNLVLNRHPSEEKLYSYVTAINAEARRLSALINDFLDLQRIEAGREVFRFEAVDLGDLIHDIVSKQEINESHTLRLDMMPCPPVYADENRLRRVILNLLSNAIKFSPNGGEIVLSLRPLENDVRFAIQDHGLGIPPEELPHLFERFQRGSAAETLRIAGTGLGLALSREIILAHRGQIWAESQGPQKGAVFHFALPHITELPASSTITEQPDSSKKRIVVIEDDLYFSRYLVERLDLEGYSVRVLNFNEIGVIYTPQLRPDLIILDILKGNEQPGWHLLSEITQDPLTRSIPVIVCTIMNVAYPARQAGASAFVAKPIDERLLLGEIARLLQPPSDKAFSFE